ncbi:MULTISPECIES: sugar phosphate isomerase/epimerase family protein [Romboutsia]|uniref:AP endonuclease, 2 n=1 Tax=Romboutsia hominis TaxID=1507512 RepID=A0A2P2BSF6_9FIRM|nr:MULTISPECIES: sugar phosphate isomerase/epimerase [Romboutsia]MCH1960586.1 sugar phosphate isomerase/epimerase [Romboutsia hominis]MCH1968982.1 sugar phosphate isomerase/epimerase [Romboutsia hominis]MDB8790279.1 sugar phosphate isomerase/epimerase [Romboutsia sp. 1001216sp1]MDB8793526.1 sugar phosphate isomerase/epimerase [Romboutsia sp. 1001216sp1]MDB8797068.1 sugar phosphate isomerase/epimerase [Romboutsia sp. 1001216sp1]
MTKPTIGVQMMMLREKVQEMGITETFKRVKEIGFSTVELSQIPMTEENVSEIKKCLDELDMKVCATSAAIKSLMPSIKMENLRDDFDKIVSDTKALNCKYIRVGMISFDCLGSKEKIIEYTKELNEFGKRLKEEGLELYYHNHHVEFAKYDGEYIMDIMAKESDPEYLGFELDVHWLQRGGVNPLEWIKKLEGRIKIIHIKDYRIAQTIDLSGGMEQIMTNMALMVQFAEIGEGNLDIKAIIDLAGETGVEHIFIEQDDTYGKDPFESLEISARNLKALGYEDRF